jgi:SAM-dependent methyltransferase
MPEEPKMIFRQSIKRATGRNLWLRYSFLAPWRLAYTAYSSVTHRNVNGVRGQNRAEILQSAESVFAAYKLWSGIPLFHGSVAEVGPGNTIDTAAMFLNDGCTHVDQIDRFIYSGNEVQHPAIRRLSESAEKFFLRNPRGYDFIVSNAVMEHLYDPLLAIRAMAQALNPGGMMIHGIDCSDHGQFSDQMHDLSFLRIPAHLYTPLRLGSGLNRVRLGSYIAALKAQGFKTRVLVRFLSGVPEEMLPAAPFDQLPAPLIEKSRRNLEAIRLRLAEPFRSMADEDLMISNFVLIAYKHQPQHRSPV